MARHKQSHYSKLLQPIWVLHIIIYQNGGVYESMAQHKTIFKQFILYYLNTFQNKNDLNIMHYMQCINFMKTCRHLGEEYTISISSYRGAVVYRGLLRVLDQHYG